MAANDGAPPPRIDYLSKDFKSFQRLMLDRLATRVPGWTERHAADLGMVLVDILAYTADYASYHQDAVATETYLGTARRRISARRHARLLDYFMHDGSNARAFVAIGAAPGADGFEIPAGTQLLTRTDPTHAVLGPQAVSPALSRGAQVFETMAAITLRSALGALTLQAAVAAGATSAALDLNAASLQPGDLLLFEDTSPGADPTHRQAVRLTRVSSDGTSVSVSWASADALTFSLAFGAGTARGNVVLVDHGQTQPGEALDPVVAGVAYAPVLQYGPVTQQGRVTLANGDFVSFDPAGPAAAIFTFDMGDVRPAITLQQRSPDVQTWIAQRDLVSSDRFATDFVVEVDDAGLSHLRFGDDVLGKMPEPMSTFTASYRVGNGLAGNVGAEAIAHLVLTADPGITSVRNPLPAMGGVDPETLRQVQINAPAALHTQERAVTLADHVALAQRHPEVGSAVARLRWNGSYANVMVAVQRRGGAPVDRPFRDDVTSFLEPFRLAGWNIEVVPPVFVPLQILLTVHVAPGYLASDVLASLQAALGTGVQPGGQLGFFHPDNFVFGRAIHWSQLASVAMALPGVAWLATDPALTRFQRVYGPAPADPANAVIQLTGQELPRIDDNPATPQNGTITFNLEGGL